MVGQPTGSALCSPEDASGEKEASKRASMRAIFCHKITELLRKLVQRVQHDCLLLSLPLCYEPYLLFHMSPHLRRTHTPQLSSPGLRLSYKQLCTLCHCHACLTQLAQTAWKI